MATNAQIRFIYEMMFKDMLTALRRRKKRKYDSLCLPKKLEICSKMSIKCWSFNSFIIYAFIDMYSSFSFKYWLNYGFYMVTIIKTWSQQLINHFILLGCRYWKKIIPIKSDILGFFEVSFYKKTREWGGHLSHLYI